MKRISPRTHMKPTHKAAGGSPMGIWVLGFVSILMDISSEKI